MEKASFLMYLDYEKQFNIMTDEQIGQLMRAIIKYEKTGEVPNLDGMLKMAFSFIKTNQNMKRNLNTLTRILRSTGFCGELYNRLMI